MYRSLIYILIIISFILVILVLSQPSKQQDALSLLSSEKSNELFETQKLRGVRHLLQYGTAFLGIIWLILCILAMYVVNC